MFGVLVYTWQPLSIAFAARALFLAVSCAQLDDFQLVETSPAPCLAFSLSLYHTICLSLSLWYGLEMEAFSSCLEIFRFTAYITGTFPVSAAPVCVCACVGMHSKVCHAYHAAFSSFAQIFTFRNHILLLESHAEPEEEPNIAKEKR